MEFKAVTLNNTDPLSRPLASRTDTQRALFVRQFKQSGQTPLAFSKSVRHQQQNLRGVAQAVSIAWYLTLATIVTATSSASHEVWPTRQSVFARWCAGGT
jgi:hypothetical protein